MYTTIEISVLRHENAALFGAADERVGWKEMLSAAIGMALADRDIAVRTGLHCAPLAHRSAGTLDSGTVRLSFSDFNTPEEVYRFLTALKRKLR